MDEWTVYRIDDEPLQRLAKSRRNDEFLKLTERTRVR